MNLRALLSGGARWHIETGDCRALFRLLPSGAVDHVITDPPYEVEAHTRQRRVRRGGKLFYRALDFHRMDGAPGRAGRAPMGALLLPGGGSHCLARGLQPRRVSVPPRSRLGETGFGSAVHRRSTRRGVRDDCVRARLRGVRMERPWQARSLHRRVRAASAASDAKALAADARAGPRLHAAG